MPISVNDFWKLAIDTRLLSAEECQHLDSAFGRVRGAQQGNAATLAEWLTASGVLSRYQGQVLLAGKARPFVFGDYKIFDRHEAGRLKGLFRAVHLPTGYSLALYFFSSKLLADPKQLAPIVRQARLAAEVQDEHLSRVFELVERRSSKFVALEDLAGMTLADYLLAQPIAPADGCRIVRDVALAAAALHAHGQAHGDIRPENIWLTVDGGVKLLGFPLARDPAQSAIFRVDEAEPSPRLAAQADYLAPELAFGRRAPDARADIYSLGCLAYRLLIGRAPFAEGDVPQKLARHAAEPAVPLEQYWNAAGAGAAGGPYDGQEPAGAVGQRRGGGRAVGALCQSRSDGRAPAEPGPGGIRARPGRAQAADPGRGSGSRSGADQTRTAARRTGRAACCAARCFAGDHASQADTRRRAGRRNRRSGRGRPAHDADPTGPDGRRFDADPQAGEAVAHQRSTSQSGRAGGRHFGSIRPGRTVGGPGRAPSAPPERPTLASNATTGGETPAKHKKKKKKPSVEPETPATPRDDPNKGYEDDDSPATPGTPPDSPLRPPVRRPEKPGFQEVDDDGSSLWASPTSGEPINVRYLPPGAQAFIAVRPSALLNSTEGNKVVDAFGPWGQAAKDHIQAVVGIDPGRIEQLTVGFYVNDSGAVTAAYMVRFNEAIEEAVLTGTWKDPAVTEHGGKKYFKGGQYAYYLPPEDKGRVVAIVPVGEIDGVLDSEGIGLGKDLHKLLSQSDVDRHFTVLTAPTTLFRDGKPLFAGELARLEDPLKRFLGADTPAAALSFHLASDFFLELRVNGDASDEPFRLATTYRQQLDKLPEELESYIASQTGQYGKLILARFPLMIRTLYDFTRRARSTIRPCCGPTCRWQPATIW